MIFQWTIWSPSSPSNFELIQNSLSVVFEGSGLSMNAQRSLNERSTVSPVFQWSLRNLSTNAIFCVNSLGYLVIPLVLAGLSEISAGLSEISVGLSQSAQWALNDFWMVSARKHGCCWSLNECSALTQWSLLISILKIEFLVPLWFLKDLLSVSTETTFWGFLETAEKSGQVLVSQWCPFCGKGGLKVFVPFAALNIENVWKWDQL